MTRHHESTVNYFCSHDGCKARISLTSESSPATADELMAAASVSVGLRLVAGRLGWLQNRNEDGTTSPICPAHATIRSAFDCTYTVRWSEEDGQHIGLCREFPSLSWLTDGLEGALSGIIALVRSATADMVSTGESGSHHRAPSEWPDGVRAEVYSRFGELKTED